MAVGNVVKTQKGVPVSVGPFDVKVPAFLAKAFNLGDDANTPKRFDVDTMHIDDECYLGKDGNLEECADFDP